MRGVVFSRQVGCRCRGGHLGGAGEACWLLLDSVLRPRQFWVWLLFGNEKSREKSSDFGRCRRGDGRKLPGYRGERGISPGLALPFLVFSAGSRWRWSFCEPPCIC